MSYVFLAVSLFAAPTNPPPESARFLHFTVESGENLSQNTARGILQDRFGFLWVATEEGLNRFDGYTFAHFKHRTDDPTSLPSNIVTALYQDKAGRLWVGTRGGLSLYDARSETFRLRVPVEEEVRSIVEDRRGRLWVGTAGEGLFRIDGDQAKPQHFTATGEPNALAHNSVYALLEDRAGNLWVGTHGGGLDLLDKDENGFTHHRHNPRNPDSIASDEISSIAEDASGRIWVGTNGAGVSVLAASRDTFTHYRHEPDNSKSLVANVITALYVDRRGTLWLGTEGLSRYVPEENGFASYAHDPQNPNSLGFNTVQAIHEDAQGNLWVSTFATGLNLLRRDAHPFKLYTQRAPRIGMTAVKSFLEDHDGAVWVGTANGELNRFDPIKETFKSYKLGDAAVLSIHQDPRGRIWAGTWGGGLYRFDPSTGRAVPYQHSKSKAETRADDQVWAIVDGEGDSLWLGTDDGIYRFKPDTGEVVRYGHDKVDPASLSDDEVRTLYHDDGGNLWAGTHGGGLNVLLRGAKGFVHYQNNRKDPKSLSGDLVLALHRDRLGRLWIGTFDGGLNLFDPADGSFVAYGERQGLPNNAIHAILEDEQGRLWLSTNNGLCRFNPTTKEAEAYGMANGLQSLQFILGAALRRRTGTMLFGTWNGFYSFEPTRVLPNPHVPPIVFTALEVLNEPRKTQIALPYADEIDLRYDEKIISFEFTVLDYTFPRRNKYAYKLEGFSDEWVQLGAKREVTFTNLDPGRYVLHIKGSNSDGVWDQAGRSLRVVIPPPFWLTWWFRISATFAALGLIFSAHRYRMRRHEERERELELGIEEAMSKLKIMKGLLPICATCKKVRDDRGYWNQIESYIRTHSEADFSHGICPDCIVKYWGTTRAAATAKKRES